MKESELLKKIQLAATKLNYRLFRNNVAKGWIGKTDHISHAAAIMCYPGDKIIRQARRLNAGLCVGSSDLIGFKVVKITESMLGSEVAVFTALEAKTGKLKPTKEQTAFIDAVNKFGGLGKIIYDTDTLEEIL